MVYKGWILNPLIRVSLKIDVYIFDTVDYNLDIKNDLTKYFKKSCW